MVKYIYTAFGFVLASKQIDSSFILQFYCFKYNIYSYEIMYRNYKNNII